MEAMAGLPEGIQERIRLLLASAPDPDHSLFFLERLKQEAPAAFDRILSSVTALRYLITLASYSNFLSEAVLRRPEYLLEVVASSELHRVLSSEELADRLVEFLGTGKTGTPSSLDLARFRRRQLLRIVLRDVLGVASLSDVAEELSNLADAILEVTYSRLRRELAAQHGEPVCQSEDGRTTPCGFAVIALGKLGGKELNYSSDIDLMFLYSGNGETSGREPVSNKEFFKKVANRLTQLLSVYTAEGMCYRVDLRLRPDGRLGEVITSLEGAKTYYQSRARDWELQMLIKARVGAGDRDLGRSLLEFVEPLIYGTTLDFSTVEAVSETRERIREKHARKRKGLDIKLEAGGIRDIEFLVQCLQRLHGGREPWVRHGGTLFALHRLFDKDLLSENEYARLASAYQFLRHLEHRLQFRDDQQTHTLPQDPEGRDLLAARMPYGLTEAVPTGADLERRLDDHLSAVRELYERVIHSQQLMYYDGWHGAGSVELAAPVSAASPEPSGVTHSNLTRFLDQKAPGLAAVLAQARLNRGRVRFEHFLEKAYASPQLLARLDTEPSLAVWTLDLFEHSPHFADQLIRNPELSQELLPGATGAADPAQSTISDTGELRRYFRRRMLNIQADSICRSAPIFPTLEQTSDLADSVIADAYRLALQRTVELTPPASATYSPTDQMTVIALGRLGMREFDLASDADLVFLIWDEDAPEQLFWTRVAERIINLISAYTGDGVIFSVDTRLRPNGREGALVQTAGAYKGYFANKAEAWEGITYMKSRAVAGPIERGTEFLHELQELDWRRYGQAMRSRQQLKQMRLRLEKEQGARQPLKAGRGGYYDIDFALMYLRLKGAGIFYKVLNTPARIDVIEKMGHVDQEDADFLRDAATFYRAVDHGLRVSTGQAEGDLPTAPGQLEILTELVHRWTPEKLHKRTLDEQVAVIRGQTREFFERLFH
jgi:[glutamine synthetase] adenylyltransferase / [glutamine synthetase]-adenylyl-L-tyrosine phosphorylase